MELLHRALGICLLVTVLGQWLVVLALTEGSSLIQPSPSVLGYGYAKNVTNSSKVLNTTAALILSSVSNVTVTPHNTTVTPHNTTVTPHNTTVTPHNTTVTPHNTTVTPHNTTVTPSHNVTVTPHSSIVKPSTHMTFSPSRNMTVFPHNSTTIMPSSSSPTPPHSVTPTPMPVPPTPGNFTLKDKRNKTCLFAYMAAKFDVTVNATKLPSILLPENATISGACDNSSDNKPFITLSWQSKRSSYNFTLNFVKVRGEDLRDSSQRWAAANVTFFMKDQHIGSEAFHSRAEVLKKVSADVGDVFHCKAKMFKLIAVNSSVKVTLIDVDFQPFDVQNGELSKHVEDCIVPSSTPPPTKPGKESHTVAIAVGCTLAGLVVIIAIAYLIGRRRKRSSAGYRKL